MLNRILEISLNNRLLILLSVVVITAYGTYISRSMNVDVFPDLTAPTVTVLTEAHGSDAREVEKLITYRIETALTGAPGVHRLRSTSLSGFSIVRAEFEWGTDIYRARQIVSERTRDVRSQLPSETSEPVLAPVTSIMGEIMILGVKSDSLSPMELRDWAEWSLKPHLKSVNGVARVNVMGGEQKEYRISVNPHRLAAYETGLRELFEGASEVSHNSSGGYFSKGGKRYQVKGQGRAADTVEIGQGFIKKSGDRIIRIQDLADVNIVAKVKIGDASLNADQAVIITISKQPGVNTLNLSRQIQERLKEIRQSAPAGITIEDRIFRQSDFISSSVSNLQQTLMEGAFFVLIVLAVFLMNWRTTLISLLAIPVSLLCSIILLHILGYTINTMSLGGMAIAVGVIVDDAVIDVENVYKRLRENFRKPAGQRRKILAVVKDASIEIRSSIVNATLIIIVAFIPLFFLGGMEGRLLKPLGIAFISSVLASLLAAITLTPVMCSLLLRKDGLKKGSEHTPTESFFRKIYAYVLGICLKRKVAVVLFALVLFASGIWILSGLGRAFLPEFNEGSMVISLVGPAEMSLEESTRAGKRAEELLLEFEEINTVSRRTGRSELDEHAQGINASEIDAPFSLKNQSKQEFYAKVRDKLSALEGMTVNIGQPISHRIDHMISGTRANIAVKIFGDDLEILHRIARQAESKMHDLNGLADISLEQQIRVPQVRIQPERVMLSAYGLSSGELMEQVEIAIGGKKAGEIYEGRRYYDLILRYPEDFRNDIHKIREIPVSLPGRGIVQLKELADVNSVSTPASVSRENSERRIIVSANSKEGDLRNLVNRLKVQLAELDMPEGYRIEYGGQFESEERASRLLMLTAVLALIVIFLLLYFEFGKMKPALLVLLNLPLALTGGIFILWLSGSVLNIAATIGFISLFGIATRNGILLVSRYEDLKREGLRGRELILSGALDRLNPILMTAFTTGLALIPLALKGGEPGNEIQSPMAVIILGGLLSATLLNLLIIPVVYRWVGVNRESD